MLLTKSQLADLRFALLAELVNARQVAFPAEVLLRRVLRSKVLDFADTVTVAQAEDAIADLFAAGYASVVESKLDDARHYQATPAGVLAHQKGM